MKNEAGSQKPKLYASLTRRALSLFIDTIVLGFIGFLLSILFSEVFFTLGHKGWWLGFFISLAYYAISATTLMGGQSIGARVFKIATISTTGEYLSLKSALVRSASLLVIFYYSYLLSLIPYSQIALLTVCGILSISYLATFIIYLLFNNKHRGLHDIVSGAIVINENAFKVLSAREKKELTKDSLNSKKPLKISLIFIAVIFILCLIFAYVNPLKKTFLGDLFKVATTAEKQTGLKFPSVMLRMYGNGNKAVVVTANVDRDTFMNADKLNSLDAQIKNIVVKSYDDINQVDDIVVVFNSGYSIGIWTYNESVSGEPSHPKATVTQQTSMQNKYMLIIFRLTRTSSFKLNSSELNGTPPDTVQWWYDGDSLWRIVTYGLDHDIHTYQITGVKDENKAMELATTNTEKNYGDIIAEQKVINFDKPLNQIEANELLKMNKLNSNLEISKDFSFWNPDNKKYTTQSIPPFGEE